MATSGQGLSFGDFGDLSPEENERIYHILHRQKNDMVEFPWDGKSGERTGDEGKGYFMEQTGFLAGSGPQSNECPIYQEAEFSFGTVQVSEFNYGSEIRHIISFDDTNEFQEIGKHSLEDEGLTQAELAERNTQSKLQASLKPYERRNKKKRPPDYYKERTDDPSQMNCYYGRPIHQEGGPTHPTVYTTHHNHSMDFSDGGNVHNTGTPIPGGDAHYLGYTPEEYNTHTNPSYTVPHTGGHHTTNTYNSQQGELQEIIVDSNNMAYTLPARTETYQIQDHNRTSSATPNVQFGDQCYSSLGNIVPVTGQSEHINTNQINSTVNSSNREIIGQTASSSHHHDVGVDTGISVSQATRDRIGQTASSSHHQQVGVDTGISVSQAIPDSRIPGNSSQTDPPQSVMVDHTAGGDLGNIQHVSDSVSDSLVSQDTPATMETATMETESNSTQSSQIIVQQDMKPKLTWAGLFKGSAASSVPPQVINDNKADTSVKQSDNSEVAKKQEKEFSPVPVPAKDDSIAEELGELLSQLTISHVSVALQPRGLVNRGNWCYINGTLQALVACPPFYNLLKKMPRYPALSRGPSSTPILDSLVEFVHEFQPLPRQVERGPRNRNLREISPGPPFEPSYVYKMLQAIAVNPHFKLGKQEDAEEFLSCILDGAHEEMAAAVNLTNKQPVSTPPTEGSEEEGYTNGYYHADEEEEVPDEENWEQVGPKKKSVLTRRSSFAKTPIADIFAGMIRSGVYKASAKETATLEPFFTLQLDIQSEKVCSVRDALEGLVSKEVISGYTDPKTNTEVEVVKKLSLEELPPVLILHLKFFVYNKDGGSQKLMKKVDYPVELEITKDLLSPNARSKLNIHQRSYKLFAVVYHHGKNMTGGHYTTCVFHPGINGWVLSDDSTVRTVPVSFVLKFIPSRVPYLLYYRRLDSH